MRSLGDSVTWLDWIRLIGGEVGIVWLSDAEVDWVLANRTAWPFTHDVGLLREDIWEALTHGLLEALG